MKQRQIFINIVIIITLVSMALGISLVGLVGLAQAASGHDSELVSPALVPSDIPLLAGAPILTVTKSSVNEGGDPLRPGERITYTITISNSGDISATNVVISDTFPANTTFVENSIGITPSGGTSGTQPTLAEGITVEAQSLVTVTYAVTVNAGVAHGTAIVNTASVTSTEIITPATGTVTDTVVNQADLSLSKTNNQTETIPGQLVTYTIVVSNGGPSSANGTTIQDTFPAALTGVSWSRTGTGGTCPASSSGNINCTINLAPGSSVTFTATSAVDPSATGTLANTATLTPPAGVTDPSAGNNSATDTDTLTPQADLSITKTNTQASPVPGTSTTYIITITHGSGPSNISGATVTDIFSTRLSNINWTCGGTGGGGCQGPTSGSGNLSSKLINVPISGSVIFTATGNIDANASGTLVNTATVSMPANGIDPVPGNNSATASRALNPQANLSITKTNGQGTTVPGNSTTYTMVVSNGGPSSANGTTIQDTFPAALTGVSWSRTGTGGTCSASSSGNINCTINLSPGGTVTFTASGTVNPGARGTLTNTATLTPPAGVTDTSSGNDSASDADTLTPQANLALTKSDSPGTVSAGDFLTYTIYIVNQGPSNRTQVVVTDNLPAGLTFISSTPSSPTCNLNVTSVVCDLNTIAGGGNASITIRVRVNSSTAAGSIINTALVESDSMDEVDPAGDNIDNESTTIQVRPDLAITKFESANPSPLGTLLTYTLRITNNGPSDAPQVNVSDDMPNGVSVSSVVTTKGSCSGTDPINCNLVSMSSGATATVTIVVNPTSTGTLNNTASVSVTGGGASDPTSSNNSSSTSTTINRVTDLAITNSDSPDPVTQGNNLTYNLTVTNNGPSDASVVTATNTLPVGVTFQSVTPGSPICSHAGGVVTCNLGSMAKGSSSNISIIVNVNPSTSGNISSTASVTVTGSSDSNISNNSALATTFVNGLNTIYLPILIKPAPTDLSVFNDNTGGNVTFTVIGTGVSCTVPNNSTLFCGSFPPGTYTVQVTSACGSATATKVYGSGPQTTRIFCN